MLDLTEGRPFRALLIFALPVIGGNLFQLFYALGSAAVAGLYSRYQGRSGIRSGQ